MSDVSRSAEACRTALDLSTTCTDALLRPRGNGSHSTIHIRRDRSRLPAKIWTRGFHPRVSAGGGQSRNKLSATSNPSAKWTVLKQRYSRSRCSPDET